MTKRPLDAVELPATLNAAEYNDLFRLLVQSVREYAIFVLDPEGNVLTWNPGAQAMKGYSREEIVGKHFSTFYPEEAKQSGWPQRELIFAQKDGRFADAGWRVRKDGTTFWASVTIVALRSNNGKLAGFAKITQDLTERRRGEERIQSLNRELRQRVSDLDESRRTIELHTLELQQLSGQLLNIQDAERHRIARELHDDLGQQLLGLKMMLPETKNNGAIVHLVDGAISTVRNLSYLLHPPLLDEIGLPSAVHWYVEGLAQKSGIDISSIIKPQVFPRLTPDIENAIFRVIQESLTNIYKHAKSDSARVEIDQQAEWVVIRIRDYGVGVAPEIIGRKDLSKMGVGIAGMRERMRQFGGELILSCAEPGTLVEAKIPLFDPSSKIRI